MACPRPHQQTASVLWANTIGGRFYYRTVSLAPARAANSSTHTINPPTETPATWPGTTSCAGRLAQTVAAPLWPCLAAQALTNIAAQSGGLS